MTLKPPKELFEEAKLLDVSSLLKGMKATKEVLLVSAPGQKVTIRKLSHSDVTKIWAAGQDRQELAASGIILKGLVNPKLTLKQIDSMPAAVIMEIAAAITDFSGLSGEAQARAQAFLETTQA